MTIFIKNPQFFQVFKVGEIGVSDDDDDDDHDDDDDDFIFTDQCLLQQIKTMRYRKFQIMK